MSPHLWWECFVRMPGDENERLWANTHTYKRIHALLEMKRGLKIACVEYEKTQRGDSDLGMRLASVNRNTNQTHLFLLPITGRTSACWMVKWRLPFLSSFLSIRSLFLCFPWLTLPVHVWDGERFSNSLSLSAVYLFSHWKVQIRVFLSRALPFKIRYCSI